MGRLWGIHTQALIGPFLFHLFRLVHAVERRCGQGWKGGRKGLPLWCQGAAPDGGHSGASEGNEESGRSSQNFPAVRTPGS